MQPLGKPRSIAVFRALQLGDMLCAVPALRALRAARPESRITLIGLPWAREFAARFRQYIDDFLAFPGFPGLPESACDVHAWAVFLRAAQERCFDVTLQMHGSGRLTNPLTVLLGAPITAGYFREGEPCPDRERFIAWREDEHEILRFLRLLRELGVPPRGTGLEFPITSEEREQLRTLHELEALPGGYACIHPGSQLPSRRWPAARFAAAADALAEEGFGIVLTGTAGEAALTRGVAESMHAACVDLAGRTSLGALAALIEQAQMIVCNDTGVSHIAAALGTPSVVVSCGSDVARWRPLDCSLHTVMWHPIECRPCAHAVCPIGHPCALAIEADTVISAARQLLASVGGPVTRRTTDVQRIEA